MQTDIRVHEVKPDRASAESKKKQVEDMFDDIAGRYDLLNRVLSMRVDVMWRNRVVNLLRKERPRRILDVATGTGDLAIALVKTGARKIVGVDIAQKMLDIGSAKVRKKGLDKIITLQKGDSENLLFEDKTFDAVTVSFGVRNFEYLGKGLEEMCRVLRPGGTVVILEFSQPRSFPFRQMYSFYFKNILPVIGKMVSKNTSAYTYLPESVKAFPYGKEFAEIMVKAGFKDVKWKALTLGISTMYWAKK